MITEDKQKQVAIVDADGLIWLACHNKKDEPIKSLGDCKNHLDSLIKDLLFKTNATHSVLYLSIGKGLRHTIYPEYKANRTVDKPPFFNEVRGYMLLHLGARYKEGFEADELCVAAHRLLGQENSFICTTDKDLHCCVEGRYYNPKKDEWIIRDLESAELNFWKSVISGDSGDNIKGIPGKGPKYAEKLLAEGTYLNYSELVFKAYQQHFGLYKGIDEFYKNYICLRMVEYINGFEVSPIPVPPIEIPQLPSIEELDMKIELNALNNDLNFLL